MAVGQVGVVSSLARESGHSRRCWKCVDPGQAGLVNQTPKAKVSPGKTGQDVTIGWSIPRKEPAKNPSYKGDVDIPMDS